MLGIKKAIAEIKLEVCEAKMEVMDKKIRALKDSNASLEEVDYNSLVRDLLLAEYIALSKFV